MHALKYTQSPLRMRESFHVRREQDKMRATDPTSDDFSLDGLSLHLDLEDAFDQPLTKREGSQVFFIVPYVSTR